MIREKTIFRNFLFGAVLLTGAASAVSCSVDEATGVSDMNAISFKSVVATRATATTVNNLNEFEVWGWKVDGSGSDLGTLMDGVVAAKDDAGTYYCTEKTYYWPGCAVDFLALSPVGVVSEETTGRFTSLTYTVPETVAEQTDLLYAYTTGYDSGTVPMNFRHALTQVEFKALNTNSWMTVEIAGVSVASVVKEGVLTLPTGSTQGSTESSYGAWTYTPTETAAFAAGLPSEAVTLGSDAVALTADGGSLFLIPEEVAAWDALTDATNTAEGAYFLISCRITELGVELWPDPKGSETYSNVAIPVKIDWEQGKKYTYTFTFGEGAGYYPPTSDASLAGTVILNGPIEFTVDVSDLDGSAGSYDEDDTADNYIVVKTYAELDAAVEGDWHYIIVEGDIDIGAANGHGLGIYTDTVIIIEDGYTITAPNSGDGSLSAAFYLDYISDERGEPNLTIDGDGTIATTGDSSAANTCCIYVREGDLTINSGTFKGGAWNVENYTGTDYCIYGVGQNGDVNVTINGGSFYTGSHTADLYANPNSSYKIDFTVNAGKFYMYDPSSYVSSDSTVSRDGDWYVVKH